MLAICYMRFVRIKGCINENKNKNKKETSKWRKIKGTGNKKENIFVSKNCAWNMHGKRKKGFWTSLLTSSWSFCFSLEITSYSCFSASYKRSSCLAFHLARLFWNQTAICLGWSPSSLESFIFLSESNLISSWKLLSKESNWSLVNRFFFSWLL